MSICSNWAAAIDIGAHVGFMSVDMAKFFEQVHAFEPQEENFKCLIKNVPQNVTCYKYALGEKNRLAGLHSPAPFNSGAWELTEGSDVQVNTLDSFNLENIGFVKIDAQGSERLILEGGRETLLANKPILMIEAIMNGILDKSIPKFLINIGMQPMYQLKNDLIFAWGLKKQDSRYEVF